MLWGAVPFLAPRLGRKQRFIDWLWYNVLNKTSKHNVHAFRETGGRIIHSTRRRTLFVQERQAGFKLKRGNFCRLQHVNNGVAKVPLKVLWEPL